MNLQELLERRGANTAARSKPGWTLIDCPFCSDTGGHLGFDDGVAVGRCFKCGRHTLGETLRLVLRCTWAEAIDLSRSVCMAIPDRKPVNDTSAPLPEIVLPACSDPLPNRHDDFLRARGFDPQKTASAWGLRYHGVADTPPWSVVIPVHNTDGRLVAWQARDITGKAPQRYYTSPGANVKQLLYGLDAVPARQRSVIVAEGVTDVWRLGRGHAVGTFGQDWSAAQLTLLLRRFDRVFILFDNEAKAQVNAETLADNLMALGVAAYAACSIWRVLPNRKDPGELSPTEVETVLAALC